MENLEISAKVISAILAKLLENGLQSSFIGDTDLGLEEGERRFAGPCFLWLEDEGLVRCINSSNTSESSAWADPVLTSRGFALLGTQLDYNGANITIAEAVEQKKTISGDYSKFGDFFGGALGGFIKSVAN
ncbi:MAG: hypothetical protein KC451_07535 [Amylibacter sp.]|nr:hypothetical protein [Amylibacter sp.]